MENQMKQDRKMVSVPQKDLLTLVASVLRDKVLFPENIEDVKQYLQRLQPVRR
ncbi:hypothetical protein LZZ85_13090 [Terrimonas sp. NA20]|uniref:Uncharacterized protein n=1 Tax=Terrimonas ginsenosidimutans TaxID=2908004 RepID=A0ABS9KSC3_9BACT|nr:hypothetical protein [Terrimonas ginsenosidimutans]MCG2615229.1 hypothetical protein [Terrimonas ginsenosidimutans]